MICHEIITYVTTIANSLFFIKREVKKKMKKFLWPFALMAFLFAVAYGDAGGDGNVGGGADEHVDEHKDSASHNMQLQGFHNHGAAYAHITAEDNKLNIQFFGSAGDLLSFEHNPQTEKQKQELQALKNTLKGENFILLPPKAKCRLDSFDLRLNNQDGHTDITAAYDYTCKSIKAFKKPKAPLVFNFSLFPSIAAIEVSYLGDDGNAAKESLSPQHNFLQIP